MPNWSDLRYFLAVQRAGTLAGAGRELGVEHTTVGRRIAALEEALGATLFVRTPDGLSLTAAGTRILPLVEDVERSVQELERRVAGDDARLEGIVRLTTSEGLTGFLVKRLPGLKERHPGIQVEVLSGNASLDLARGEADLAVRLMKTTQPDLVARKLADCGWSLYAADGYVARAGAPGEPWDLSRHDVVGYDETMSGIPGAVWLAEHARDAHVVLRGNSIISVLNAAIVGMGLAVLPCFMADAEPNLRRLTKAVLGTREMWLVFHPDRSRVERVRAVMDFVVDVMTRERDVLRGCPPASP